MRSLVLALLLGCTYDVHLGTRDATHDGACDPLAGADCACSTTAECPRGFYCMPSGSGHHCEPPAGCTVVANTLQCSNSACSPTTNANCVVAPACNANVCADSGDTCCQVDFHCYPTTCVGCC